MEALVLAITGAAIGIVTSVLGLVWSAVRSVRERERDLREESERRKHRGQINVKLSSGRSISIDVSSATPEELVNFIDSIKGGGDVAGKTELSG